MRSYRCSVLNVGVFHGTKGSNRSQKRLNEGDEGKEWGVSLRAAASKIKGQFRHGSGGGSYFSEEQAIEVGRNSPEQQIHNFNSGFHGRTSHSHQPTKTTSSDDSGLRHSGGDDCGFRSLSSDVAITVVDNTIVLKRDKVGRKKRLLVEIS